MTGDVLDRFSPATAAWFRGSFSAPTAAQEGAWEAISSGHHALVVAPTGSGKTLSAFLWALDRLASQPVPEDAQGALPGPLRLADEGARRRRRAQPAQPARRHPARRHPPRAARARHHRLGALGRHPGRRAAGLRPHPHRRAHHDARVAVPHPHLGRPRGARRRRDGHRRRGARPRRHQARRPPRALPRAARRPARAPGAADRAVRHRPTGRGGRPLPRRRPPGRGRAAAVDQGVGPQGRRPGARHGRARPAHRRPVRRGSRAGAARLDLAARRGAHRRPRRRAHLDPRLLQQPPPRRAAHHPAQRDLGGARRGGRGRRHRRRAGCRAAARRARAQPRPGHGAVGCRRAAPPPCSPAPTTAR